MYLFRQTVQGKTRYAIRETYRKAGVLTSRELFDLGSDPAGYIHYPGGNAFYIDLDVEDQLASMGVDTGNDELEDIFWPFVRPDIRRAVEHFRHRKRVRNISGIESSQLSAADFHLFDKRRLFYLKTGRADQKRLGLVPAKHFKVLAEKSRDELEQQFLEMERILKPREIKTYVYVAFDLQQFFNSSFARSSPELLDQTDVDRYFIRELCRLNDDAQFWEGVQKDNHLHRYLARYVVMFFDYDYPGHDLAAEFLQQFINSRRRYRPPPKVAVKMEEASRIFGKSISALKQMSRSEFARLYRKKAMELHPDQGGDHDKFVQLTNAYHGLMAKKRS